MEEETPQDLGAIKKCRPAANRRSEWRKITEGLECPTCKNSQAKGLSYPYAYRIVYGHGIEWYCRGSPFGNPQQHGFHTRTNKYTESRQYQQALTDEKWGWAEPVPDQEFTTVEVIKVKDSEKVKVEVKEGRIVIRTQNPLPKPWKYY